VTNIVQGSRNTQNLQASQAFWPFFWYLFAELAYNLREPALLAEWAAHPILNSMHSHSDKQVFAIVLAAGVAARFGSTKQLQEHGGKTLVRRALDLAEALCDERSILVVGHDWPAVHAACQPLAGFLLCNDRPDIGIGRSISQAARSLPPTAKAVLILLADQALITTKHLQSMLDTWSGADDEIVATAFAGTEGPPVLFPRSCFAALTELDGDQGARDLLRDDRFTVKTLTFEEAAIDIDTPRDLSKLGRRSPRLN
jgi:CTP:molybdopterin cytidylyltransferase MocA